MLKCLLKDDAEVAGRHGLSLAASGDVWVGCYGFGDLIHGQQDMFRVGKQIDDLNVAGKFEKPNHGYLSVDFKGAVMQHRI